MKTNYSGVCTGFVQFIESVAVAEILAVEGSIVSYFRKLAPNDNTASGIAPELMDNYVKSCGKKLRSAVLFHSEIILASCTAACRMIGYWH